MKTSVRAQISVEINAPQHIQDLKNKLWEGVDERYFWLDAYRDFINSETHTATPTPFSKALEEGLKQAKPALIARAKKMGLKHSEDHGISMGIHGAQKDETVTFEYGSTATD